MRTKRTITQKIEIKCSVSKVYNVLTDIEHWDLWTKSITSINYIDNSRFEIGGKVRVMQPKLFPAVWTITDIKNNESFTWETSVLGVTITAIHSLTSTPAGTSVELSLVYDGFLSGLLLLFSSKLATQNLIMEINGLKAECERHRFMHGIISN